MKRPLVGFIIILILGLITGCAYLQKPDVPPPLPPIEETKPPLTMKSKYFEAFPWGDLATPRKDGNDPDTRVYPAKEGDTFESVAENMMGNPGLAQGLAKYNELPAGQKMSAGEKIVIPNPIIGVSSQVLVKAKREKAFGGPQPFNTEFKKGDEYKLRFVSNVDGYLYVFRQGAKSVELLYPTPVKKGRRNKAQEALPRDSGKIRANDPKELPIGTKGYASDDKKVGDRIFVFLSLREDPDLEALKEKKGIKVEDVQAVMHRVKEGEVFSEPPYHLLRIADPKELLGLVLNIGG
ncbi:MAG: hypothetical protein HY913_00495 [Desulfomonile tiedjei]|nr:hypothetical protein [Desulfomonile tiedjei]